jgi:DNA-binding NtrC family response regulator
MNPHVLIVDDELRFRELYMQILGSAGFSTQAAASAEEALSIIRGTVPSMVVSDVRMPGANGIDLLRLARREHPGLPFLLVTAYAVRSITSPSRLISMSCLRRCAMGWV